MKELLNAWVRRSPFIIPLLAAVVFCFFRAGNGSGGALGSCGYGFIAFAPLIIASFLIAQPIAEYLGDVASRLYMPAAKVIPPPLWYLIEHLIENRRYEDALAEYNKIIHYHPHEIRAHLGRLELLMVCFRDLNAGAKAYRNSLKKLKAPADHQAMTTAYNSWQQRSRPSS